MTDFTIRDSGQRQTYPSGMVRDTTTDKVNYLLIRDGPMYERWAAHLTKGARKYAPRNWLKADSEEELEHFLESFSHHVEQWLAYMRGNRPMDEDHGAAIFFNIDGAEYVRAKLEARGEI